MILVLALVWLVSRPYPYTMLPFAAYAVNWIATYAHLKLRWVTQIQVQPPLEAHHHELGDPLITYVAAFTKHYVGTGRLLARTIETFLWLNLLPTTARGPQRSNIPIVVFTTFLGSRWARYHAFEAFQSTDPAQIT
jgi:hypothetical protein